MRDVASSGPPAAEPLVEGRRVVAVIGIDRYRGWPMLSNAVHDALGVLTLFERRGFAPITPPRRTSPPVEHFDAATDLLEALFDATCVPRDETGPHEQRFALLPLLLRGHATRRSCAPHSNEVLACNT